MTQNYYLRKALLLLRKLYDGHHADWPVREGADATSPRDSKSVSSSHDHTPAAQLSPVAFHCPIVIKMLLCNFLQHFTAINHSRSSLLQNPEKRVSCNCCATGCAPPLTKRTVIARSRRCNCRTFKGIRFSFSEDWRSITIPMELLTLQTLLEMIF